MFIREIIPNWGIFLQAPKIALIEARVYLIKHHENTFINVALVKYS